MKSPEKIKEQMEFWFLKYHGKEKSDFSGTEIFTLYDLVSDEKKEMVNQKLNLVSDEKPVYFFQVDQDEFIINTTERFIRIFRDIKEDLGYQKFDRHEGFKAKVMDEESGKPVFVRKSGVLNEFGIKQKSGEVIYWRLPSGRPSFGFWNITDKCELIGRKYLNSSE